MMRASISALCAIGMLAGIACHHGAANGDAYGAVAGDTTVLGIVRVSGSDPGTQVELRPADNGRGIAVTGALRGEIGSLSGVAISATGQPVPNQMPSPAMAIDVRFYEVVSVGDTPARGGMLTRNGTTLWLAGAHDTLELAEPVPARLSSLVGRRVYVAGTIENHRMIVQAFGAITQ